MIDFSTIQGVEISAGAVTQIEKDGVILWNSFSYGYVSLGDSIAVGHRIDDNWEKDYGWDAQYGVNGNALTTIVPNSYTDLIRNELKEMHGTERISVQNFARSGDTVADLMEKLSHAAVRNAIERADVVTICIGANDVLHPVLMNVEEYINTGDLTTIINTVEANLAVLADDSNANSYTALFNRLKAINHNAKYVFTTIYNPYKYLWIEEGENGFFKPMLDTIPQMTVLGFIEVDKLIKEGLLNTSVVQTLFDRVNGLDAYAENFVTKLNTVLRSKITAFGNANFLLADTKAVFDPVPDRPITAPKHYDDLVNVEYTRGFNTADIRWYPLWADQYGEDYQQYWFDLAVKHCSLEKGFDVMGFVRDLVPQIVGKIIEPNIDPHPETYGHYALMRSFSDVLGWKSLDRHTITYHANGGTGTMAAQTVVSVDGLPAFVNIATNAFAGATGYYFTGWNTKADGTGTAYSNGQFVGLTGNLTLYAQWSNVYTVTFRHSMNDRTVIHGSGDTGPMQCYALWIDGTEQADLGAFSNPARTYRLPYGKPLGVIAMTEKGSGKSYITFNGTVVQGESSDSRWDFRVTGNMDIHFEWNYWLEASLNPIQSHWNCYITTA